MIIILLRSGQRSENTHQKVHIILYSFRALSITSSQHKPKKKCTVFVLRYLCISITLSIATCFRPQGIPDDDPLRTETYINSQLIP